MESYYLFDEKDGIITEDKNYNNNNTNIDLKNFNIKEKKNPYYCRDLLILNRRENNGYKEEHFKYCFKKEYNTKK